MRTVAKIVVTFLCAAMVALDNGAADAQTPTPTATAASTPEPTATASPAEAARFTGSAWVDARPSPEDITAKIGDIVCGSAKQRVMADAPSVYELAVVADTVKPGCGREGAPVTFFVGDRQASQTFEWHAGTITGADLTAGPPFAYLGGTVTFRCPLDATLLPFVGDQSCGYAYPIETLPQPCSGDAVPYQVVVYSNDQQPGCGVEGAELTFKLMDAQNNVIAVAREKGVWHAWGGVSPPQQLNLTLVAVAAPKVTLVSVGDALWQGGEGRWWIASVALAAFGLAGIAVGAALRRRAT